MKQLIEAKVIKVEDFKDDKNSEIKHRLTLEITEVFAVKSHVKPTELNKPLIFEVKHHDFTNKEDGRRIKGFKIVNQVK